MITIVLLLKNAERYLTRILQAIYQQDCQRQYEVLAIDSGSMDGTLDILAQYPVRLIQIPPESFRHGDTRNLGAKNASNDSEYIVYLTQDALPLDKHWLQNLLNPMEDDPWVAGAFSRHIPNPTSSPALVRQLVTWWQSGGQQRLVKQMPESHKAYQENKFFLIYFSNTSSIIRRSVWEKIPWPEVDFAEDAVWADQVLKAGYKLVFEPDSIVVHSHDYNFIEQFRQNVDHTHAMIQHFNPPIYQSRRFWARQFLGLPKQVWLDWKFLFSNEMYRPLGFWRKLAWVFHSPGWQFASVLGALVGAWMEKFPLPLQVKLSRQERIKQK